jgi:hypothetical protein
MRPGNRNEDSVTEPQKAVTKIGLVILYRERERERVAGTSDAFGQENNILFLSTAVTVQCDNQMYMVACLVDFIVLNRVSLTSRSSLWFSGQGLHICYPWLYKHTRDSPCTLMHFLQPMFAYKGWQCQMFSL